MRLDSEADSSEGEEAVRVAVHEMRREARLLCALRSVSTPRTGLHGTKIRHQPSSIKGSANGDLGDSGSLGELFSSSHWLGSDAHSQWVDGRCDWAGAAVGAAG